MFCRSLECLSPTVIHTLCTPSWLFSVQMTTQCSFLLCVANVCFMHSTCQSSSGRCVFGGKIYIHTPQSNMFQYNSVENHTATNYSLKNDHRVEGTCFWHIPCKNWALESLYDEIQCYCSRRYWTVLTSTPLYNVNVTEIEKKLR